MIAILSDIADMITEDAPASAVLARRSPVQASPEDTLAAAVRSMHAARCSSVVVTDGQQVVGIWSAADALELDLSDPEVRNQSLASVMSRPVVTLSKRATVAEARASLEASGVQHLLLVDDEGVPAGVVGLTDLMQIRAVQRTQQLEAALADTRARLHAQGQERRELLASLVEGVFGIDDDGRFTFLNPVACRLLGFAGETEALGRDAHILNHHSRPDGTPLAESECPIRKVLRTGHPLEAWEDWFWRRDGRGFPVQVFAAPRSGVDGPDGVVVAFSDISERKAAEAARANVLAILGATPDLVAMSRSDGRMIYFNRGGMRLLGVDSEGNGLDAPLPQAWTSFKDVMERIHPQWALRVLQEEALIAAERDGVWRGETAVFDRQGREIPVSQIILAHYGDNGQVTHFSTIMRDISGERALQAELRRETAFSQAVIRNLPGAFYMIDQAGQFVRWNRHLEEVSGREGDVLARTRPTDLFPPEERALIQANIERVFQQGSTTVEAHLLHPSGEARPYYFTGNRVDLENDTYLIGIGLDISRRKAMEQELEHLATHDPLTGLYNRTRLYELLEQARANSERYATPFSLIMFDIDHFKLVNDRFGHQAGDEVLRELARRVNSAMRETDLQARWGGEEFLVLATHTELPGAAELAERIRASVAQSPFEGLGPVTISLGVATYQAGETLEQLERRVDEAMYRAKRGGRNRVEVDPPRAGH